MGHPWIFRGMIERFPDGIEDGDVVHIRDARRRPMGMGLWNSQSKLAVRVLSRTRCEIDEGFFRERLTHALAYRRKYYREGQSFRLVHAEADGLSGLIVDLYGNVAVLQISSLGLDRRKDQIVRALVEVCGVSAVIERGDFQTRKLEGMDDASGVLYGDPPDELDFSMNSLQWRTSWKTGHKTGCYLDQQSNYDRVARWCRGKKVLDTFTFQGGFAIHAALAGAAEVTAIDQSQQALDQARAIQELNRLPDVIQWKQANVFDWLKESSALVDLQGGYDVIVLDPPSFARSRTALDQAFKGYKEIHLRALRMLAPGGILATFCCSHHVSASMYEMVVSEAAFDCRMLLRRIETFTQSPDHPILPVIPETEYLKGFAYEVTPF